MRPVSVRIPKTMPPGLYLLLIYDGSEGGEHDTWEYFHLLGATAERSDDEGSSEFPLVLGVAGVVFGVLGGTAALLYRRRLQQ